MSDVTLVNNAPTARKELEKVIERALWAIGAAAEGYAKRDCPVDTGRLRNSIAHTVDESEQAAYIGTNVEYAAFVEFGTSRHPEPQPYLRPAATEHNDEYKQIAEASLKAGG